MSVDFTPSRGEYTELKPFRYWCQKVLPLVYDDSLSYYELLSKILDSLNKAMEDVETLNDDVTALYTAYTALQDWITDYVEAFFEGEGVQNAVNAKIDAMVVSGVFGTIVNDKVASQINAVVANQLGTVVQGQLPSVVQSQIPGVVQNQLPGVVNNQIGSIVDAWLDANITPDTTLLDRTINATNKAPVAYDMKTMLQAMKSNYSFIDKYTMFDYPGDISTGRNDLAVMEYMTRTWEETVSNKTVFIQFVRKGNSLNLYNVNNNEVHCYPSLIPITRNLLPPLSADFSVVSQTMPSIPNVATSYNKNAILNYFINLKSNDAIKIVVDIPITNTGSETPVVCLTGWKLVKIYVNSSNNIVTQNLADFIVTGSVADGFIHAECEYTFGDINKEAYEDPATVGFGLAILTGDTSVELTTYQESGFEEGVTYSDNTNFFPKDSAFNITITGEVVDTEVADLTNGLAQNDIATYVIKPSVNLYNDYDDSQETTTLWVNGTQAVQMSTTAKSLIFELPENHGRCFLTIKRTEAGTIFRAGTLPNKPVVNGTYSYVVQGQTKEITIECAPEDNYLLLTYYNSSTDTKTEAQLLAGLSVIVGPIVTEIYSKADYEEIPLANFVNAKYVRYSDSAVISFSSQTDTYGLYDIVPLFETAENLIAVCAASNTFVSKITFLSTDTLAQSNIVGVWTNSTIGVFTVPIPAGAKYVCVANECDGNGNVVGNPVVMYNHIDVIKQTIKNYDDIANFDKTAYDGLTYTKSFNGQRRDSLTGTIAKLKTGTLNYTILGDSITDAWAGHRQVGGGASDAAHGYAAIVFRWLKQKYGNTLTFVNNGTGGITVTETIDVVDDYIASGNFDLCVIELGTNDWNIQTPIETFKTNYRTLLDTILALTNPPEIFIVGLGYFGSWHSERGIKEKQYNDALREIAKEYDVPFASPYDAMKSSIDFGTNTFAEITYTLDPVHPNDAGHVMWANAVYDVFAEVTK